MFQARVAIQVQEMCLTFLEQRSQVNILRDFREDPRLLKAPGCGLPSMGPDVEDLFKVEHLMGREHTSCVGLPGAAGPKCRIVAFRRPVGQWQAVTFLPPTSGASIITNILVSYFPCT